MLLCKDTHVTSKKKNCKLLIKDDKIIINEQNN